MKPGAIITPKVNDPARGRFYVRSVTRNGWVRCHSESDLLLPTRSIERCPLHVFKFRTSEMEVVG